MAERTCILCNRVGKAGFDRQPNGEYHCSSAAACKKRVRQQQPLPPAVPATAVKEPAIKFPPATRDDFVDPDRRDENDPDGTSTTTVNPETPSLVYHERGHRYYLNGKRAKGVSTIAKIAADDYMIRLWHERMVAAGVTIDENLRENVAMHIDNRLELNNLCEDAKKVAKAHLAADRGSQKHRVLELVLTGQEHKLITPQQREDAVILKRTLDRYRLVPHGDLAEQFITYPDTENPDEPSHVCGRFDAVLDFEKPDGSTVLVDLKSGENAVNYPHATACQLAMYTNAPYVSEGEQRGDKINVTTWRSMPERLIRDVAYVLLVTNDGDVGSLHAINIEHGWKAAELALALIKWRRAFQYGDNLVSPVVDRFTEAAMASVTQDELRAVWIQAAERKCLTPELRSFILARKDELEAGAANASAAAS